MKLRFPSDASFGNGAAIAAAVACSDLEEELAQFWQYSKQAQAASGESDRTPPCLCWPKRFATGRPRLKCGLQIGNQPIRTLGSSTCRPLSRCPRTQFTNYRQQTPLSPIPPSLLNNK